MRWQGEELAAFIALGRAGAKWCEIGRRFFPRSPSPWDAARKTWERYAGDKDRAARAYALAARQREIAALIRAGRRGDSWQVIGAAFYRDKPPERAASAAATRFNRQASDDDKEARRRALKRENFNLPRGFDRRALHHAAVTGSGRVTERVDPWAGMGAVFA